MFPRIHAGKAITNSKHARDDLLLSLGNVVLLLSFLGLLGANTPKLGVRLGLGEGMVSLEVLQLLGELQCPGSFTVGLDGHKLSGELGGLLDVFLRGVALSWLLSLQREQDQLSLVFLKALGVELERLHKLTLLF
jgi:hypothetical protein